MDKKKKRSSSLDRRVQGYLDPRIFLLFEAYLAFNTDETESSAVNSIMRSFFTTLPPAQVAQYLQAAKDKLAA